MSHIGTAFHEVDAFLWFDQHGLSPYWTIGSLCIQQFDGYGETTVELADGVWHVKLAYNANTGIAPRESDDVGGDRLYEYDVDCVFETGVRLVESNFEDMVELSGVTLSDTLDLTRSTCEDLRQTPSEVEGCLLADGTETIINTGLIRHPTADELFCHFEQATIGAVEFVAEDSMEEAPQQLDLRWVRFVDTAYDGFDFTHYRRCLEPDWQLHQFTAAKSADDIELSPAESELAYMRAKSGADDIGDNRAAGEFFQREMRARRARHKRNLFTDISFRAGYRYVGNRAFWLSSNYAESPQRVLGNSLLVTGIFAGLYAIGFQTGEFLTPYSDSPLLGYRLLSGESFVTLVHSPAAPIPSAPLRAVVISEGVLRAFAIALFLFTLTRAVHR